MKRSKNGMQPPSDTTEPQGSGVDVGADVADPGVCVASTVGYVVISNGALELCFDQLEAEYDGPLTATHHRLNRRGVLLIGNVATVFKSRDSARSAIKRTCKYFELVRGVMFKPVEVVRLVRAAPKG